MTTLEDLSTQLNTEIQKLPGQTALTVQFLNSSETININETTQFWAASVIKILIACEFFNQANLEKIDLKHKTLIHNENLVQGSGIIKLLDPSDELTYLDLVKLMLTISDNTATNELVDLLGWENIDLYARNLNLTNTTFKHKMMIKAGRGPNLSTTADINQLLLKLYKNQLPGSQQLLTILKEQQDRRRIPLLLPNDVEIANKTGSLERAVHDAGIVFAKNPFIFVFFSDDQEDKLLTVDVIAKCAKYCFDFATQ
jgi:beta-lactamase class A